ncbi:phospholipase D-like domain-containing protein [Pseudoduganella namucuonensis]|uniref:PLD-like domain-containing protein n=1 Tax=Pseudoduganella namucuonensis TaxID=1035707 RepID=A0A1I7LIB1_9BURK|nr:phospholipase D-like domain-containing protein [Pseudoduganella namucuonensis]SFV09416.1 PLD-like domain-containing protein [Pseudoduganella namucuonensis]
MASMNENADLYDLSLYYNRHAAPYQCLVLPWWVRAPHPVYSPRHRCQIELLNCGQKVFGRIAEDIRKAKHSVDIITWGFDPGMVLERDSTAEAGQRFGDLLKEVALCRAPEVQVRLLVWHDDPLSQMKMKNIPGYYGRRFSAYGSGATSFYSEQHMRYNAEWFEQICAGEIPNIRFHVRSVPGSARAPCLRGESVPKGLMADVSKLYAAHHQKMILIDYERPPLAVGYVMGHNSTTDFWDTEEHVFRDPRRERLYYNDPISTHKEAWEQGPSLNPSAPGYKPTEYELAQKERAVKAYLDKHSFVAKPYQDVSSRLRGPVLADINHNFCQAWEESEPPSSMFLDAFRIVARVPLMQKLKDATSKVAAKIYGDAEEPFIQRRKAIPAEKFQVPGGQHSVQLLRTQPMHGEKAIKECYANLTRQMHHYMFIQNQYVQYETWAEHLCECVERMRAGGYRKQVYVFILTSTPEINGMDLPTYDVARTIGLSDAMVQEHNEALAKERKGKGPKPISPKDMARRGINVVMGSLWTCAEPLANGRLRPDQYEEIYIHAKVAIVDDAAFTIGSANLNLRSMALDSELNVLSDAREVAYQLRCDLFRQCTGQAGPQQFADMDETFREWTALTASNFALKKKNELISSQLLSFYVDRKPGSPVV